MFRYFALHSFAGNVHIVVNFLQFFPVKMNRKQFEDLRLHESIEIGDVWPMNRGEMDRDLRDAKSDLDWELYQATGKEDKEETVKYLLAGIAKMES